MKVFGLWERLTKIIFFKGQQVAIDPATQTTAAKTITIPDMSPATQEMVLADQSQTLTNKTLSGGTLSGTIAGTPTFSGATVTFDGDIAVNGGDITTTSTTPKLLATNTGTIDFGSLANVVNIANDPSVVVTRNVSILSSHTQSTIANLATGQTAALSSKTVNIGTGGLADSYTNITIGSVAGNGTTTLNNGTVITYSASKTETQPALTVQQLGTGDALLIEDQSLDSSVTRIDNAGNVGIGVEKNANLTSNKVTIDGGDVLLSVGNIKVASNKGIQANTASSALNVGTTSTTTTLNLGNQTGDANTVNIATGATSSGATKTVNIATNGNTGSTVNVVIGSDSATSTTTVNKNLVVTGNLTISGTTIATGAGNALSIGDSNDSITIPGNLIVQGTTTTIDTTNLEVKDKNILLNNGGTTASASGAGISIEGDANAVIASVQYDAALASKFKLGANSSESEVITKDASQTLLSKKISSTAALTGALELPAGTQAERPGTPIEGMIRYNSDSDSFEGYAAGAWAGIGGGGTVDKITQASAGFVVGDVLYLDGSTYTKAKADAANTAEVVGVVSRIVDATPATFTFEMTLSGEVAGFVGLTPGEVYFLDASTAGAITAVEPSVVGQVSLPVGVASSETSLYVAPKRGVVVGGANLRTQIGLNGAALVSQTTNIQNVKDYDAGELSGWVYINATTARRFYIQVQFVKNAAGAWNCAYQTTGDTPPAGFNVDVIVSGSDAFVQVQMPPVAGWSSGSVNFALNAPAVGTSLPLQIDSTSLTNNSIVGVTGAAATAALASGSGKVGEVISATPSDTTTTTFGVTLDINNASITLSPGLWHIEAMGNLVFTCASFTAGTRWAAQILITAGATNTILTGAVGAVLEAGGFTRDYGTAFCSTVVNVTTPTVYKMRLDTYPWQGGEVMNGGSLTFYRSGLNRDGFIRATRIA